MNRKISPMSRTKCWLNGPVAVTPGTRKYQVSGEPSMKTPFASAATPSTTATPRKRVRSIYHLLLRRRRGDMREPPVEPGRAEARSRAGHERLVVQLHVGVGRLRIADDLARVLVIGENPADQVVDGERLGAGDL